MIFAWNNLIILYFVGIIRGLVTQNKINFSIDLGLKHFDYFKKIKNLMNEFG